MIKSILHKVFSIAMAFLVLCSTVSFTIESHYCGSHLVDTAIFSQVKKCGDNVTKPKPCCKDEIEVVKGQDTLDFKTLDTLEFDSELFIVAFTQSYILLYESLPKRIIPNKDYSPPNLTEDIQLLDQTFLI